MIRVLFLIRSLGNGGAERQLTELACGMDRDRFEVSVATFYPGGARWEEIAGTAHVRLVSFEKKGRWTLLSFLRKAFRLVRLLQPQVIYSFAQEPNLIALLIGRAFGARVVWGIRRSTAVLPVDIIDFVSFLLNAFLSRFADRIIYNSHCGFDLHVERGFSARNALVVSNGFDTSRFFPDDEARRRQRAAWGLENDKPLIGIVGRLHPVKNHLLFFQAAVRIFRVFPEARFAVIGDGCEHRVAYLRQYANRIGIESRVICAGEINNMASAYNALDILALCSKEEGCPNVVGEAMACGVACVVTDVGDAGRLLGERGLVVRPDDPEEMAEAWRRLQQIQPEEKQRFKKAARERIIEHYSLLRMIDQTSALLQELGR